MERIEEAKKSATANETPANGKPGNEKKSDGKGKSLASGSGGAKNAENPPNLNNI